MIIGGAHGVGAATAQRLAEGAAQVMIADTAKAAARRRPTGSMPQAVVDDETGILAPDLSVGLSERCQLQRNFVPGATADEGMQPIVADLAMLGDQLPALPSGVPLGSEALGSGLQVD